MSFEMPSNPSEQEPIVIPPEKIEILPPAKAGEPVIPERQEAPAEEETGFSTATEQQAARESGGDLPIPERNMNSSSLGMERLNKKYYRENYVSALREMIKGELPDSIILGRLKGLANVLTPAICEGLNDEAISQVMSELKTEEKQAALENVKKVQPKLRQVYEDASEIRMAN